MIVRLIFISFFCLSNFLVLGQFTYPPYKQYTVRDGLAQMQVWCLHQDSRGYIWIGTKGGLSRFDGEKFTSYTVKDGLIDNFILEVFEDHSGNIWVVCANGLGSFDGTKFTSYPFPELAGHITTCLSPDGKIWYLGETTALKDFFGYFENGQFHDLTVNYPELDYYARSKMEYSPREEALFISTLHQVFSLKSGELKQLIELEGIVSLMKQDSGFLVFEKDESQNYKVYEYQERQFVRVAQLREGKINQESQISQEYIYRFPEIFPVKQIIRISPGNSVVTDFPEHQVNVCLKDRDKHLWIGTEEGLLRSIPYGIETYKREALPIVWSMVEDHQKNIWFASYNYGLRKFDGKEIQVFSAEELKNHAEHFYFQAQVDDRGVIYFPNVWGILYYDGKSFGSFKERKLCTASFYDKDLQLLFGGYYKHIEVYDLNHKLIRRIDETNGIEIKGYFGSLGKDRLGYLWFGGRTGLVRYNWETKRVSNYNQANGKLPSDGVLCIYTIPGGTTWFGGEQGLLWYDEKNDSIRKVEHEELTESVSLINSIDSTWLVLSQPAGIYLMNLKKFGQEGKVELHLFNEQNGFLGLEPGQNGAMKDSKGNIWMTTSTEVVKLDPSKIDFSEHQVDVRISGFNGLPLSYQQKEIVLPKNDRTAVLQFEAICFNRPKPVLYSWRVDGENDWSPWQKENYAVITDLHDGMEIIQVRAKIPGLPNAEAVSQIPLFVNLALWKQAWFFPTLLGVVSFFVILALLILFQTRAKMVQINRQAKMFQLQAILSQMNPHFIFNVMASLQSMIIAANLEKANEYLVKMSNLVRGFLDASVSTTLSKTKQLKEGELPLSKELEILQNFIQFQQLIYPEKFDYELQVEEGIDPNQCTIPPMLIQPFVENAIRHGLLQKEEKGLLSVLISRSEHKLLQIEIVDDGIGMRKAGEMMRQSHLLYTSRGKELTEKRIKLLNEMGYHIQLDIQSSDQGTHVVIKINHDVKV